MSPYILADTQKLLFFEFSFDYKTKHFQVIKMKPPAKNQPHSYKLCSFKQYVSMTNLYKVCQDQQRMVWRWPFNLHIPLTIIQEPGIILYYFLGYNHGLTLNQANYHEDTTLLSWGCFALIGLIVFLCRGSVSNILLCNFVHFVHVQRLCQNIKTDVS